MADHVQALNDDELEKVVGGNHLSSNEVKSLSAGQMLMIEDDFGNNLAEAEYTGSYEDPGAIYMLRCWVRVTRVYSPTRTFSVSDRTNVKEGDYVSISRYNLDFIDRA